MKFILHPLDIILLTPKHADHGLEESLNSPHHCLLVLYVARFEQLFILNRKKFNINYICILYYNLITKKSLLATVQ